MPRTPSSTLFPYTTLFRSMPVGKPRSAEAHAVRKELSFRKNPSRFCRTSRMATSVAAEASVAQAAPATPRPNVKMSTASRDRKSTRLNSSHVEISYAVFCLNHAAHTQLYTLSLHDALPIYAGGQTAERRGPRRAKGTLFQEEPVALLQNEQDGDLGGCRSECGPSGSRDSEAQCKDEHGIERSEEHTSELQSRRDLVCRLLLESCRAHPALHSFPTRRSSDLCRWANRGAPRPTPCERNSLSGRTRRASAERAGWRPRWLPKRVWPKRLPRLRGPM